MSALNYSVNRPALLNSSYETVKPPDGVISSSGSIGGDNFGDQNGTFVSGGQSSGQIPYWDEPTTIVLSTVLSILIFLSVGGNLLVISVVVRHRGMRTRTNMFLVNLAMADFLVGLIPMPFSLITLLHGGWIFNDAVCTLNGFLNALCLMTSNQLLMYISIHKYFSITRPFSRFLTVRKIFIMIAAAWMWATFCSVITVTGLQRVLYKNGTMHCGPDYPRDLLAYIHHGIIQVTDIIIPIGVMIFCYTRIFIEIRQHTRRMRANSTLEKDTILAQQKKVTITLFIVLACFICCWLPYHLYASYVSYKPDRTFPPIINAVAYTFGYVNSACNPIIYALRSPSFRDGYMEILCRKSAVVVSDDSLQPGTPSSFRRRVSTLFGSMRGSVRHSRSGSEIYHTGPDCRLSSSNSPCKLQSPKRPKMARLAQRSPKKFTDGSSIVKRNGSIVVMKAGKIVCVRNTQQQHHDNASLRTAAIDLAKIEHRPLLGNGHVMALKTDSGFQDDRHSDDVHISDNNDFKTNNNTYNIEPDNIFDSSETIPSCGSNHDNRLSASLTDILECSELAEMSKSLSDLERGADARGATERTVSNSKLTVSRSTDHFDFSFFKPPEQIRHTRLSKSDNCLDKRDSYEDRKKLSKTNILFRTHHKENPARTKTKIKAGPILRLPSVEHLDKRIRPKYRRSISDSQETKPKPKLTVTVFQRRSWLGFRHKASVLKTKMSQNKDEMAFL